MAHVTDPEWLDLVHDPVIVREQGGRVVKWNGAAAERYGYSAEEAVGCTVEHLLSRTFCGNAFEDALLREHWWEGEVRVTRRDGKRLVASCRQYLTDASTVIEVHGPIASHAADLRLVIDHLPGLVSYIDCSLRYRFANRVYTDWFGTPEHEIVGALVEEVLGTEAFSQVRPEMERALKGELVRFDTFLPYVRGGGKHVSVSYVPDRHAHTSDIRGFVVLVEDNTARYHAEQSLRASERQYRQIVETAQEGIWIIGPDARTTFANQRMAELLRTTAEQLLGAHSFDYVFDEDAGEARRLFENKMRGDRAPFDFRLRRADGLPMWARVSGVPMTDERGAVNGLLGMFTDITSARAAEHALRDSEQRFRTLLANLPDIVSRFDREGRFMYISPAVQRATGLNPEAFLGKSHAEAGVPEPLASYLSARLYDIVATGTAANVDFKLPAPDGFMRSYHGLGVPEYGEDGAVKTVLTIVHDVTDQRRAEEALRRSNAELEQFAYAASHDLQEPLRVVETYTELFVRRYVPREDLTAGKLAGFIVNGVRQMQALVRDLLAYSRAVHEEPQPFEVLALDEPLDQAIAALEATRVVSGARIEREPLPMVMGEKAQLAQVFQNLLSNALKYQRAGVAPIVHVWAERAPAEWIISVRDNGIGFNPMYAERIFGLFKRLHREAYPGTGVGLGICRRIVERYGGRIWAESLGEGAWRYIPLYDLRAGVILMSSSLLFAEVDLQRSWVCCPFDVSSACLSAMATES